ncbi:IclR family transcriptional regulator [bacterium RCC_150]
MEQSGSSRFFAILDVFLKSTGPLTLSEVSEATGLPMPTAYRYLRDLAAWGGLQKSSDGAYRTGPKLWMLGSTSVWERTIRREAHPLISALSQGLHQAVALTFLHKGSLICIDRVWGTDPSIYIVNPGDDMPLPPTSAGKLLLSRLSDNDLEEALRVIQQGEQVPLLVSAGSSPARYETNTLEAKVHEVRDRGYALTIGELRPGQTALSVVVNVPRLEAEMALSVLTPLGLPAALEMLPHLKDAAIVLEKRLAKSPPLPK